MAKHLMDHPLQDGVKLIKSDLVLKTDTSHIYDPFLKRLLNIRCDIHGSVTGILCA